MNRKQLRVVDLETGREMIVYQNPNFEVDVQLPMEAPAYYPQPYYQGDSRRAMRRRKRSRRVPKRERRRRESKARLAGSVFAGFILSWVPTAFMMPGLTLCIWGLGGAYLLYRTIR